MLFCCISLLYTFVVYLCCVYSLTLMLNGCSLEPTEHSYRRRSGDTFHHAKTCLSPPQVLRTLFSQLLLIILLLLPLLPMSQRLSSEFCRFHFNAPALKTEALSSITFHELLVRKFLRVLKLSFDDVAATTTQTARCGTGKECVMLQQANCHSTCSKTPHCVDGEALNL